MEDSQKLLYPGLETATTSQTPLVPLTSTAHFQAAIAPQAHRTTELMNCRDKMQDEVINGERKMKIVKKQENTLSVAASILSAGSTVCGGSAVASALTGVTALAAIPLGVASGLCGIVGVITSRVQHKYANKRCRASEKCTLARKTLTDLDRIVSSAIQDKTVTHEEFNSALNARHNYYKQLDELEQKRKGNKKRAGN